MKDLLFGMTWKMLNWPKAVGQIKVIKLSVENRFGEGVNEFNLYVSINRLPLYKIIWMDIKWILETIRVYFRIGKINEEVN